MTCEVSGPIVEADDGEIGILEHLDTRLGGIDNPGIPESTMQSRRVIGRLMLSPSGVSALSGDPGDHGCGQPSDEEVYGPR